MNYKLNSYLSILAIACAVAVPLLSANAHELPVQAAFTPPSNYDINYRYNSTNESFAFGGSSLGSTYQLSFTRTGASPNYAYTSLNNTNSTFPTIIPENMNISVGVSNSNSSWSTNNNTSYFPSSEVSSITSTQGRFYIQVINETNYDYALYLDLKDSGTSGWSWKLNNIFYYDGAYETETVLHTVGQYVGLIKLPVPASYTLYLENAADNTIDFEGFYLEEVGLRGNYDINEYNEGYADGIGNNPNVLITAFESLIGMMVNFTFILFTLEMFGVSILSIVGVLFGYINRKLKSLEPSPEIQVKEDYELSILYYKKDGGMIRYNNIVPKTKYNAVGGCGKNRLEQNKIAAEYLKKTYPDLVSIFVRKNGNAEIKLKRKIRV
jgi:hypothetical protein